MATIIGTAVGTALATKLPFDTGTNIALGMASGQLITLVIDKFGTVGGWLWTLLGRNRNTIKIYANEGGRYNPIYKKMEEYILDKYTQRLIQCNLAPVKGEVSVGLREALFKKPIEVIFKVKDKSHKLWVCLSEEQTNVPISGDSNNGQKKTEESKCGKTIVIYSMTASIQVLKVFVTDIVKLEKKQSNILTVYRAIGLKKNQTPHWDCLRFKSNKTMDNTILKKQTEDELFKDIDWFMKNEKWYNDKGRDYKIGYMLHGVPGTGKTSAIKAIANKYNLPIFNIDLESITTNEQLITVTNDIIYEAPDHPYIMAIEDFDRHAMFADKWNYNGRSRKVTMQCLLNVIDGVVETHGRILIITCNEKEKIEKEKALVRPGRIDRIVEIGYVNGYQVSRLLNNYFDVVVNIADDNIEENVTPAQLIKKMQTSQSLESTLFYICKDSNIIKEQLLCENNEIFNGNELIEKDNGIGPTKMDKPMPFKDDDVKPGRRRRLRRATRRGNPGKNSVEKKAWTIKQKEKQIKQIDKNREDNKLKRAKCVLELKLDKKRYSIMKKTYDERQIILAEKNKLKKQRERERIARAKNKRKREQVTHTPKKKKQAPKENKKRKLDKTKIDGSNGNGNNPYVTRSGRIVKTVYLN